MEKLLWLGSLLCFSFVFMGCGKESTADQKAAPKPNPRLEVNIYFPGAEKDIAPLAKLEGELGIKFGSATWYIDWQDGVEPAMADRMHDHGLIPQVCWQPQIGEKGISNQDVDDGKYDDILKQMAATVRDLGFTIRISLAPEMNGDEPWGMGKVGNTPANHKAFWRHIVTLFRKEGAKNVQWVWAPNVQPASGAKWHYAKMYPGDDWVDFVGLDGYNWGTTHKEDWWQSPYEVFGPSYKELTGVTNKPILLMETASAEKGGDKAKWIANFGKALHSDFPRIHGFYWFDEKKEADWRIDSTPAAKQAFKRTFGQ